MAGSDIDLAAQAPVLVGAPVTRKGAPPEGRAIFHPLVDFLCLGGASLVCLPLLLMAPESSFPALMFTSMVMSSVFNNPHFAASYQIFYRGFPNRLRSPALSRSMRRRYVFAGVIVPALLSGYFAYAFLAENARMIGWSANLMLLLVGWHYTKQGYGMLIVDSVYRKRFFSDAEKAILRYNAYACWLTYWLFANWIVSERQLWGLAYYSLEVPVWALYGVSAVALATTGTTLAILVLRLRPGGQGLPPTGTVAYLTSLYIWLAARFAPAAMFFVPAFHSLQYLLIVGRYEANRQMALQRTSSPRRRSPTVALAIFGLVAVLLGLTGFVWAPELLEALIPYDRAVFGGQAFLFMFWVFINVHHYCIDNVIWRRDNPETGAYLFGAKSARP